MYILDTISSYWDTGGRLKQFEHARLCVFKDPGWPVEEEVTAGRAIGGEALYSRTIELWCICVCVSVCVYVEDEPKRWVHVTGDWRVARVVPSCSQNNGQLFYTRCTLYPSGSRAIKSWPTNKQSSASFLPGRYLKKKKKILNDLQYFNNIVLIVL